MREFSNLTLEELTDPKGYPCECGKHHTALPLKYLVIEPNCISRVIEALQKIGCSNPFLIMGPYSRRVAGEEVMAALNQAGMSYSYFCFTGEQKILPDEESLEKIEAAYDAHCDFILGIGSGVINDLCKMVAKSHGLESGIVATAPSMDGYASNSAAMELKGIKTTVYTACPSVIICDTEIIRNAPFDMLCSGFGDMAAKIISIADWRIAHLITGEYYCENVAELMLDACNKILDNAEKLYKRDEYAVREMMKGLVLSGITMSFAGVSRPASGMEHTISHLMEMFSLARGRQPASHGIQVGYGTRIALKLYHAAEGFAPANDPVIFDSKKWESEMREVFGNQAETLIDNAMKEGRNSTENILERRNNAIMHWEEIQAIIAGVTAQAEKLESGLDMFHIPQIDEPEVMGFTPQDIEHAVLYSRDLRNRYIFTSMCFDIGLLHYADNVANYYL